MVLTYDAQTEEAVICSGWGLNTDWIRNIRALPALQIQIGRESYPPEQHFLSGTRASRWWPSFDASILDECASSPGSSAGEISAATQP